MSSSQTACPICSEASKSHLLDRPDYEYGIPTRLAYHRCTNDFCGLVFADPIPADLILSFYAVYSTHDLQLPAQTTFLTRHARRVSMQETINAIGSNPSSAILDYGCGNGQFLKQLREAGFINLTGYDFDRKARAVASEIGASVADCDNDLAALGPFDVITMNHVIEHLVSPAADLARLSTLIKPGGRIIIRTPNARSALSRVLGSAWRGWETPRHIHLFSPESIRKLMQRQEVAHLTIEKVITSNAMFFGMFHESLRHPAWASRLGKLTRHALAFISYGALSSANRVRGTIGEELVIVLRA